MQFRLALITGASSGFGAEYARQLADRGTNLILVARTEAKLQAIAEEVAEHYGVMTEVLAADLSRPQGMSKVVRAIENHPDIDLLINNAGYGLPGEFHTSDIEKQVDMLRVHIEAVNRLTRAALPAMAERRQGAVINLSSVAGFGPGPGSINYSATKGYLIRFSKSLSLEMKPHNVRVQAFCPGFTHTGFHDTPELKEDFDKEAFPGFLWAPVDKTVAISLRALDRNRVVVVPHFINKLNSWLLSSRFYFPIARAFTPRRKR